MDEKLQKFYALVDARQDELAANQKALLNGRSADFKRGALTFKEVGLTLAGYHLGCADTAGMLVKVFGPSA